MKIRKTTRGIPGRLLPLIILGTFMQVSALAETPVYYEYFARMTFTPEYDQSMKLPGVAELFIPSGALSGEMEVAMTIGFWTGTEDPELFLEFAPHGAVFNEPIRLDLFFLQDIYDIGEVIGLFYFDEETGTWEQISRFRVTDAYDYTLEIPHFSIYAFSKIRNGN